MVLPPLLSVSYLITIIDLYCFYCIQAHDSLSREKMNPCASSPRICKLGNIRPTSFVTFGAFEQDSGGLLDPDDTDVIAVLPSTWYRAQTRRPYDLTANVGDWRFYYTVQTECC